MASGRLSSVALLCVCSVMLLLVVADVAAAQTDSPRNQQEDHSSSKLARKYLRGDHHRGEWGCAWKVIFGLFEQGEPAATTESVESTFEQQVVDATATASAGDSAELSAQAADETATKGSDESFARRELSDYGTNPSGSNCSANCKK